MEANTTIIKTEAEEQEEVSRMYRWFNNQECPNCGERRLIGRRLESADMDGVEHSIISGSCENKGCRLADDMYTIDGYPYLGTLHIYEDGTNPSYQREVVPLYTPEEIAHMEANQP
jgi:hypothetical protein